MLFIDGKVGRNVKKYDLTREVRSLRVRYNMIPNFLCLDIIINQST